MDDSQGVNSVGLTASSGAGKIKSGLNKRQPESIARKLLSPLAQGKPVALVVDDPRLPKRKRVEKPTLFLTPLTVYGRLSPKLMVALETHGCEVIDTLKPIKPLMFHRMGLSVRLANVIAGELNQVFTQGDTHGTT